ncbi:MAG: hypothetical protein EOS11_28715 [Mesorhizobium sp.]|nr:MAG: hypothetical protein EOS11_28715 [Mesorhizobium sp.]
MNAQTKQAPDQPMVLFRQQLEQRLDSFAESLPPQITPGHFKGVIMRAVMASPALLGADRVSLFESALAAANDGLLPDKREGAFVIYRAKEREGKKDGGREVWIDKVQWMPMIRGIFTKLYNTGEVKSAKVAIVYAGDHFRAWTDDAGDHIEYEEGEQQDRSVIRNAFAHVVLLNGGVFVETMKPVDIEKIRSKSKAKESGPWVDWWEEMAKKSVFRRLAKRLPMSRIIMPLLERDNVFHDLEQQKKQIEHRPVRSLASRLDDLAGGVDLSTRDYQPVDRDERGAETTQQTKQTAADKADKKSEAGSSLAGSDAHGKQAATPKAATGQQPSSGQTSSQDPDDGDPIKAAARKGRAAYRRGMNRKAVPVELKAADREAELDAYLAAFDDEKDKDADEPGSTEAE